MMSSSAEYYNSPQQTIYNSMSPPMTVAPAPYLNNSHLHAQVMPAIYSNSPSPLHQMNPIMTNSYQNAPNTLCSGHSGSASVYSSSYPMAQQSYPYGNYVDVYPTMQVTPNYWSYQHDMQMMHYADPSLQTNLKHRRSSFSRQQTKALEDRFAIKDRIEKWEREAMAKDINMTAHQILVWFANRRAKIAKEQRTRYEMMKMVETAFQSGGCVQNYP